MRGKEKYEVKNFVNYTYDKIVIYISKKIEYKSDEYEDDYVDIEYIDLYKGDLKKVPAKYLEVDIRLIGAKRKGVLDI